MELYRGGDGQSESGSGLGLAIVRGVAMPLTEREREIAEKLAPVLWGRGLLIVGLDMIGGHLTEINVTSPTCMVEIAQQTGFDVAGLVVNRLERAVG